MMEQTAKAGICSIKGVKIPKTIEIKESDKEIKLILDITNVMEKNMQMPGNAFEGWLFILKKLELGKKITLSLNGTLNNAEYLRKGHLCRFLYRVMKFEQQYKWCNLSKELSDEVRRFRSFLSSDRFTNNIGSGEAGRKTDHDEENAAEEWLASKKELKRVLKNVLDIGDNPVYRQLPVGLFKNTVCEKNRVFTGGKSAIDLWTWNKNELNVVELKTKNRMIGIVTEIFFYSNYVYDLVVSEDGFDLNNDEEYLKKIQQKSGKSLRGYENLQNNRFNVVNGIMLADKDKDDDGYHPWVKSLIDTMNDNGDIAIKYYIGSYLYEEIRG